MMSGKEMVEVILAVRKWKDKDLAQRLNVNTTTVWRWRNKGVTDSGTAFKAIENEWKKIAKKAA